MEIKESKIRIRKRVKYIYKFFQKIEKQGTQSKSRHEAQKNDRWAYAIMIIGVIHKEKKLCKATENN